MSSPLVGPILVVVMAAALALIARPLANLGETEHERSGVLFLFRGLSFYFFVIGLVGLMQELGI